MKIAFSPCPNDTFVFHAWVHGLIPDAPRLHVTYADIDITNQLAEKASHDILKVSYAALPWMLSDYALLNCGGALGRGCGPLVLTRSDETADPRSLAGCKVAVPSDRSTAYLLFRLWTAELIPAGIGEIIVMPFHEIMPAVRDGAIDAGLVIHEARFTYHQYGLYCLADLGQWWEESTGFAIPLGAIVAKRSLNLQAIQSWIRASVEYAWANPTASRDYVMEHAQEMDPEVAKAHIDLYVNEYTRSLGEAGYDAVTTLLRRAMEEKLMPRFDLNWLRS